MNSAIERLLSLRVSDIMAKNLVTVSPDQKLADAARLLIGKGVSGAPVVDVVGQCVGILSATDFVRHCSEPGGGGAADPSVRQHMSPSVQTISERDTLVQAARKLCQAHIHRLPVVAARGQIIGWVSSLDVVAAMIHAIEE